LPADHRVGRLRRQVCERTKCVLRSCREHLLGTIAADC
jgi:hypothetical protein